MEKTSFSSKNIKLLSPYYYYYYLLNPVILLLWLRVSCLHMLWRKMEVLLLLLLYIFVYALILTVLVTTCVGILWYRHPNFQTVPQQPSLWRSLIPPLKLPCFYFVANYPHLQPLSVPFYHSLFAFLLIISSPTHLTKLYALPFFFIMGFLILVRAKRWYIGL